VAQSRVRWYPGLPFRVILECRGGLDEGVWRALPDDEPREFSVIFPGPGRTRYRLVEKARSTGESEIELQSPDLAHLPIYVARRLDLRRGKAFAEIRPALVCRVRVVIFGVFASPCFLLAGLWIRGMIRGSNLGSDWGVIAGLVALGTSSFAISALGDWVLVRRFAHELCNHDGTPSERTSSDVVE